MVPEVVPALGEWTENADLMPVVLNNGNGNDTTIQKHMYLTNGNIFFKKPYYY